MKGTKPEMQEDPDAIDWLNPPEWMDDDAAGEWRRVMPILSERRILSAADLGSLENYCIAIGTVRAMERDIRKFGNIETDIEGKRRRNPAVGIQSDAMTRSRLLAAELGLTPVSRSRPSIRDEKKDDDEDPLNIS